MTSSYKQNVIHTSNSTHSEPLAWLMIIIFTFNHGNSVTGKQRLAKLTVQMVSTENSISFISKCVCTIPMAFCDNVVEFVQTYLHERIDHLPIFYMVRIIWELVRFLSNACFPNTTFSVEISGGFLNLKQRSGRRLDSFN